MGGVRRLLRRGLVSLSGDWRPGLVVGVSCLPGPWDGRTNNPINLLEHQVQRSWVEPVIVINPSRRPDGVGFLILPQLLDESAKCPRAKTSRDGLTSRTADSRSSADEAGRTPKGSLLYHQQRILPDTN